MYLANVIPRNLNLLSKIRNSHMQPLDGLTELVNIFGCRQDTQLGEQFRRRFPSGQQKKISLEKA